MPKIVCISDTHGKHAQIVDMPTGDILLHAGDFSSAGTIPQTIVFLKWFEQQPFKHKIFISGNHDFLDQEHPSVFKELVKEFAPNCIYLRDEGCTVEGITIWGRPWTPEFYNWAFMADRGSPKLRSSLDIIPTGTDIILTHGPAKGILDRTMLGERVGCEDMLDALDRIKPKLVVCGHIHESVGITTVNGITHINAAVLNERYEHKNKPLSIDIS